MLGSYLERGLASVVKLKGGKDEVSVIKSFCRLVLKSVNETVLNFTAVNRKDGCGATPP